MKTTTTEFNPEALNYVFENGIESLTKSIQQWAVDRNLHTADPKAQLVKMMEEVGEVAAAICRGDKLALQDGIGDTFVTLVILAQTVDLDFRACVDAAYQQIKHRKGKLVDGIFIKEE